MADASTVSVLIRARDEASKAFKNVEDNAGRMAQGIAKHRRAIGMSMIAMGGAMTGFAIASVKAASDLEESMNAVNVIFGEGAEVIHKFGETSARAVGMSTAKFNEMSTVTGARLKDVGLPMDEVARLTTDLAQRAADMASVMNTDVSDAMSAMNQALRGETEAIRRYAGDVTEASLQTFAFSQGINKNVSEMTEQEKRLLRVGLMMEQTANMAGDFANTSDSLANRMRIAKAEFANTTAELGTALLPVMTQVVEKVQNFIAIVSDWIRENPKLAATLFKVAAALGVVSVAVGVLAVSTMALSVAMSPVTLVILGVAAAITGIIILYKKWDDMSTKLKIAFVALAIAIGPVTGLIVTAIAVWKNWDVIISKAKKTLAEFAQGAIEMARKVLVGLKAVSDFTGGMFGASDALQGAIDQLDNMSGSMDDWANETELKMKRAREVVMDMGDGVDDMAGEWRGAAADVEFSNQKIMDSSLRTRLEQETHLKELSETRDYFRGLNATAEAERDSAFWQSKMDLRDKLVEATRDELAKSARLREQAAQAEILEAERVADAKEAEIERIADAQEAAHKRQVQSWDRFFQDQHPVMLELEENNLRFMDVVQLMAEDSGKSLVQMGLDVQAAGVTWGDTFALINSTVATNMQGILANVKNTSEEVVKAAVDMGTGAGQPGLHFSGRSVSGESIENAVDKFNATMSHTPLTENELATIASVQKHGGDLADLGGRYEELAKMSGLANGGFIKRGGMALVGERGPEIVSLPGGSTVHPNGRGPGGTNNFHFHGAVYGVEDLKEAVVEAVRDHAISGGFSGVFAEA